MSSLIVRDGPMAGRRVTVESEMSIGRENADFTIEDPEVSRRHAVVRPSGDGVEIEDQGSTNGTFVNDNRIQSATQLSPGDVVRMGGTTFEVEQASRSDATVVAPMGRPGDTVIPSPVGAGPSQPQWGPPSPRPPAEADQSTEALEVPPAPPRRRAGASSKAKGSNAKWLLIGGGILAAAVIAFFVYNFFLKGPSKEDFIAQADEICEQGKKDLGKLNLRSAKDFRKALDKSVKISTTMLADLKDLEQPDEDQKTLDKFFATFADLNGETKRLVRKIEGKKARPGDLQRFQRLQKKFDQVSKDYGFKKCRAPSST